MRALKIKRVAYGHDGTFGVMLDGTDPFALTCERPWLNNKSAESCIPEGTYRCQKIVSPHFGLTYEVTQVPGRSHILLHRGNTSADSQGCILIGEEFGRKDGKVAVLSSAKGFEEFLSKLAGNEEFMLSISSDDPPHA